MQVVVVALFASFAAQTPARCSQPWIGSALEGRGDPMFLDRPLVFDACGLSPRSLSHNRLIIDDRLNGSCSFDERLRLATCVLERRVRAGAHSVAVQSADGSRSRRISILFAREGAWSERRLVPLLCAALVAIYFGLWATFMLGRPLHGWTVTFLGMFLTASIDRSRQLDSICFADLTFTAPLFVGMGLLARAVAPEDGGPEPRWWRPLNALSMVWFVGLSGLRNGALAGFQPAPPVTASMILLYALALAIHHVHKNGHRFRWSGQDLRPVQRIDSVRTLRMVPRHAAPSSSPAISDGHVRPSPR